MLREVEAVCNVSETARAAHVASAMSRGLPICQVQPERSGRLAIVGSGPSVHDHLSELPGYDEVWAINGALNFLSGQGINPTGFVALDALPFIADHVRAAPVGPVYYIASCCHPSVFDALAAREVRLWHSSSDITVATGGPKVNGGTTCITRAPFLAHVLGWRDITIFGADSSHRNGEAYCYPHGTFLGDTKDEVLRVRVGDDVFLSELGLMQQASQLCAMVGMFGGQLKLRGSGLVNALLVSPERSVEDFHNAA